MHETVHRRISLNTQRPGHQCDVPGLFLIIFQFRNVCATFINVHLRVLLRGRYRRVTKHVLHRPSISSHPSQTCGRRFAMSRRLLFICQSITGGILSRTNQGIDLHFTRNFRLSRFFFKFRILSIYRIILGCQSGCQFLPCPNRIFVCHYYSKR